MSSLNIKQGSDAHFPDYPLASPSNNEIDLLIPLKPVTPSLFDKFNELNKLFLINYDIYT